MSILYVNGPNVLVCAPVHLAKVRGSTRDHCTRCFTAVWVAPSGRDILAEHPRMVVLCLACGADWLRADRDAEVQEPTPTQLTELAAWLREPRGGP